MDAEKLIARADLRTSDALLVSDVKSCIEIMDEHGIPASFNLEFPPNGAENESIADETMELFAKLSFACEKTDTNSRPGYGFLGSGIEGDFSKSREAFWTALVAQAGLKIGLHPLIISIEDLYSFGRQSGNGPRRFLAWDEIAQVFARTCPQKPWLPIVTGFASSSTLTIPALQSVAKVHSKDKSTPLYQELSKKLTAAFQEAESLEEALAQFSEYFSEKDMNAGTIDSIFLTLLLGKNSGWQYTISDHSKNDPSYRPLPFYFVAPTEAHYAIAVSACDAHESNAYFYRSSLCTTPFPWIWRDPSTGDHQVYEALDDPARRGLIESQLKRSSWDSLVAPLAAF